MHELEKVRKQLEVEKLELQSALEEAEVKGLTPSVCLSYASFLTAATKIYWLLLLVEDHVPSNHDCLQS